MTANLRTFRADLEDTLRRVLPDPRNAAWIADLVLAKVRQNLAGQRIPALVTLHTAEQDRRIHELMAQGVTPHVIAERLGISRSTVYRAEQRELGRIRSAA